MYNKRSFQRAAAMAALLFCFAQCNFFGDPIVSCNREDEKEGKLIMLRAAIDDTLRLSLDSQLVIGVETPIQYLEEENALLVYDSYGKRLLTYPLVAAQGLVQPSHIQSIRLDKPVSYFYYLGPDSLILYAYKDLHLYYYNPRTDSVYKTFSFFTKALRTSTVLQPAPPNPGNALPLIFKHDTIIGAGYLMGENRDIPHNGRTICSVLQLANGRITYKMPYPDIYRHGNWGGAHMRTPYMAYNPREDKVLLSTPIDHQVQVIDQNWEVHNVPATSGRRICMAPLLRSYYENINPDFSLHMFTRTTAYRDIIFDPYQQRYYRIVQWGITPPDNRSGAEKPASIIAFDKDFHYLGEADLPLGLALDNFFVTAQGIYFFNANNHEENTGEYLQIKIL